MENSKLISISGKMNSGKDLVGNIIQWLTIPEAFYKEKYTIPKDEVIGSCILDKSKLNLDEFSKFKIIKFADKLKDMVCILLGCTREMLEDREYKEKELGEEWWYYEANILSNKYEKYNTKEVAIEAAEEYYDYVKNNQNRCEILFEDAVKNSVKLIKPTPRLFLQLIGTECFRNIIHPNSWVNATFSNYIKEKNMWILTDTRFPNELEAIKKRGSITIKVVRSKKVEDIPIFEHESETALDNFEFDYTIINDGSIEELVSKVKEILVKEGIILK